MDDWDKVTYIRKPKPTGKQAKSNATLNRAAARGELEVNKKVYAAGNKPSGTDMNLKKALESEDIVKVKHVSVDVSRAIAAARVELGITQKDLAAKINEPAKVINEYESGKAVPSQQVLSKLEKILKVKLRGKEIGKKLEPRPKK